MNKEFWIRKLTSRKFVMAITAFIVSLLKGFGAEPGSIDSITSMIVSGFVAASYILGEGLADAAGAKLPAVGIEIDKKIDEAVLEIEE